MFYITRDYLKVPAAMLAAAFVTTVLFFLMHLMVYSDDQRVQETFVIPVVDATMPEIDPPELVPIQRPEPLVEPPPSAITEPLRETNIGTGPILTYAEESFNLDPPGWQNVTFQSAELVPVVRTAPVYPTRALQRGIEGFVVVTFTVDERGNVADPAVTYADPEGYFERAALQSITKWRYSARVEDGRAVPVQGVQQRIVFEIAP